MPDQPHYVDMPSQGVMSSTEANNNPGFYPVNPLNAELNPICHLLALLGGATIVVVSRLRVKKTVA
jgi:hypothetical protein